MCKNGASWLTKLVILLLAIPNPGPVTAAAPLSTKACDLLTVKDVEGVLGAGYTQQEGINNQITSSCAYSKGQANLVGITLNQEQLLDPDRVVGWVHIDEYSTRYFVGARCGATKTHVRQKQFAAKSADRVRVADSQ